MLIAFSSYVTSTISVPEIIWTTASAIGVAVNYTLLRQASMNLGLLRQQGINSLREFAAISSLISEILRTLIQFILFTIGVANLFIPALNVNRAPTTQWVNATAFIIVTFMLVGASMVDKWRRDVLVNKILRLEDMSNRDSN